MDKFIICYLIIITAFLTLIALKYHGLNKIFGLYIWNQDKKELTLGKFNSNSQLVFDEYSFTHLSSAVIYYAIGLYLGYNPVNCVIIFSIIWEIVENTPYIIAKFRSTYSEYIGDSWVNLLSDIAVAIILSQILWYTKITLTHTLILFLILEFFSWLLFRDGILTYIFKTFTGSRTAELNK